MISPVCLGRRRNRPGGPRQGQDQGHSRRGGWSLHRARRPARCCPDRAASPAPRSAGCCRADAGRWKARREHRARRADASRSAWPAGCAGPRRRSASPRCGRAKGTSGPTAQRNSSRSAISWRMRSATKASRAVNLKLTAAENARLSGREVKSAMERPPILTASDSGRRRLPRQTGQGVADI